MNKLWLVLAAILVLATTAFINAEVEMTLGNETTVDSLGACQGVSYQNGRVFLYGDRETGVMREFKCRKTV